MRSGLLVGAALLLGACATAPSGTAPGGEGASAYRDRSSSVTNWTRWGFTARLSIDDGQEGGSGRLDWTSRDGDSSLQFRGALGQGAWRLTTNDDGATLVLADGRSVSESSVHALVERETGWQVPVDRLAWWVRGLPAAGDPEPGSGQINDAGQLSELVSDDWTVTYSRWVEEDGTELPSRLEATNGQFRIKLAISRWWFSGPDHG